MALRKAFLLQAVFMVFNNTLYLAIWWLLFKRFPEVAGWKYRDMLVLHGVAATGYGLTVVCFGGTRDLARTISDGGLDPLLTQPRSVLLQVAASRSIPSGWGDVASGLLFLGLSDYVSLEHLPVVGLALLSATAVFTANSVLVHSAAFWAGDVNDLARQAWELLVAFSSYPPALFDGGLKVFLFTVVPAGLAAFWPAQLIRQFDLSTALLATAGAVLYALVAVLVFHVGLRRYASGNKLLVRS